MPPLCLLYASTVPTPCLLYVLPLCSSSVFCCSCSPPYARVRPIGLDLSGPSSQTQDLRASTVYVEVYVHLTYPTYPSYPTYPTSLFLVLSLDFRRRVKKKRFLLNVHTCTTRYMRYMRAYRWRCYLNNDGCSHARAAKRDAKHFSAAIFFFNNGTPSALCAQQSSISDTKCTRTHQPTARNSHEQL